MISLIAAFRTTIMLSSDPVDRSVFCTPLAIISTAENTNTTSAIPNMVITVVSRREVELRMMYFSGICIRNSETIVYRRVTEFWSRCAQRTLLKLGFLRITSSKFA